MFSKIVFIAFLAAVNAGVILTPEAKVESVSVAKTSISGTAGNITQEHVVPVVTHPGVGAFVEHPFVRLHEEVPFVAPQPGLVHVPAVAPLAPAVYPHNPAFVSAAPHVVSYSIPHFPLIPQLNTLNGLYYYK